MVYGVTAEECIREKGAIGVQPLHQGLDIGT
jgi:hypothetical protein